MLRNEGKLLTHVLAVAIGGLCAHMAFAAGPALPPESVPSSPRADRIEPAVVPSPSSPFSAAALADNSPITDVQPEAAQIECIAKVIRHEAANQPIDGQIAVAQVIRARMEDGRFPTTACGVVKQRGQFFDVDAYDPPRDDKRWETAVRIAIETLNGDGEERAEGALFFHSAGARMPGRIRVAQIADHTFYR